MRAILLCLSALTALAVAACSQQLKSSKPAVALVMKSLANDFFKTMEEGARAHQRQHAAEYDLLVNGIKDEQDVSRQIDIVEQMVAQRVDAIVIAPADSRALVTACKRALDAGIVVINIDNRFDRAVLADKGVTIPFVGPDNRKGARLVGEYLARQLPAASKVAVIEGAPNAFNAIQRTAGFRDAMDASGMRIVSSQAANWETDRANQIAAAVLTQEPDLKAILCANDSMALGAVAAVRAAGREGQVKVVGFDNIPAVSQLVRQNKVVATVDQHGDQLAVFGIEYALEMIRGRARPADRETPVDLIAAGR